MDLRERLRLLKAAGATRGAGNRIDLPAPQAPVPAGAGPEPSPFRLGGCLDGWAVANEAGEAFYVQTRYPLPYRRGPLPLEHCLRLPSAAWERLGRVPTADLRSAVFLDTETTGLAGGTGTYAFLVGLGFFAASDFVVRQYFLRDYGEEEAMLAGIERDLERFSLLVSFNGKSFDWPLLETRCRMARRKAPMRGAPHLDLLHPARRIWKERLGQCSLTNLEARVLGVHRQGDVPGALIPQLYFDYLRSGRLEPLVDVVLHNRLDIVSLVSLAGFLGQVVTTPLEPTPDGELLCGDDLFALGRLLVDRGLPAEGLACLEAACQRSTEAVGEGRALQELSHLYKRLREHDRAVSIWQSMIAGAGATSLYPYNELAKYYEHVTKEYDQALEMAARALSLAQRRRSVAGLYGPGTLKDLQAIEHRIARLTRKVQAPATAKLAHTERVQA